MESVYFQIQMSMSVLQKITRQGLRTVNQEAGPVALVTEAWPSLATSDLGGLKSPWTSSNCHHHVCWQASRLCMIATSVEQEWPQGHVKFQHKSHCCSDQSSIFSQFRGTYESVSNLNGERPIADMSFAVHSVMKKSRFKLKSRHLLRDRSPSWCCTTMAVQAWQSWELPERLNSEVVRFLNYLNKLSHCKLLRKKNSRLKKDKQTQNWVQLFMLIYSQKCNCCVRHYFQTFQILVTKRIGR